MDDWTAIEQCRDGNADAFRHIVEHYQAEAMGHALAIVGDREEAEDLLQEAFVKAFRALGKFEAGRPFYPWFYTILRNCCFKRIARRPAVLPDPEQTLEIVAPAMDEEGQGKVQVLEQALARADHHPPGIAPKR